MDAGSVTLVKLPVALSVMYSHALLQAGPSHNLLVNKQLLAVCSSCLQPQKYIYIYPALLGSYNPPYGQLFLVSYISVLVFG